MVSPSQKRCAAEAVVATGRYSQRQVCRYLGLARSSFGYVRRAPTPKRAQAEAAVIELSRQHPRYGYRRIHALIQRRGLALVRATVQRIRQREGLGVVGPARRVRRSGSAEAKVRATGLNDVWCVDLVFDTTMHGVGSRGVA